jgi:hypothetical protein
LLDLNTSLKYLYGNPYNYYKFVDENIHPLHTLDQGNNYLQQWQQTKQAQQLVEITKEV